MATRAHHYDDIRRLHAQAREDLVRQDRTRRGMPVARDHIADIVRIACDRRQFLVPLVVAQSRHDVPGDVRNKANMAEPMLGEPEDAQVPVRRGDHLLDLRIVFHRLEGEAGMDTVIVRHGVGIDVRGAVLWLG